MHKPAAEKNGIAPTIFRHRRFRRPCGAAGIPGNPGMAGGRAGVGGASAWFNYAIFTPFFLVILTSYRDLSPRRGVPMGQFLTSGSI